MKPENMSLLKTYLVENGIIDIDRCIQDFEIYSDELIRWNKVINLTSIYDEKEIVIKHFIDSLTPLGFIKNNDFVLDIGTGAGFPGLPLKIVKSSIKLLTLDARLKKVNFVNHVINILNIKNASSLHQRAEAEDFKSIMKGIFDVVISRASFSLSEFINLSMPYLKIGGRIIAMRGREVENTEPISGLKQADELITSLPDGSYRKILLFKKT
ncbi:MAG: 16S rRNA (guanine(527)-N(7))-methyltransferase RsmG [Deltaproteobacteria bacterium]|nr:16S rRNA (guanine(527)-N(7))-methyltransferase RsmG [Deltaproteobacteria bacterium]